MSVSAEKIKQLRELTSAGVLDCRRALEESDGDIEQAVALLREKGIADADKRADRATHNGVVDLYNHGDGRVGVMVEVNCETDFVARTEEFRTIAHEIALQIAATSPRWIDVGDVPEEVMEEKRSLARKWALDEGKPEQVVERIIEGRLEKFLDDACLLRQEYIRDDSKTIDILLKETIASTGENITVRRFQRWEVGEDVQG